MNYLQRALDLMYIMQDKLTNDEIKEYADPLWADVSLDETDRFEIQRNFFYEVANPGVVKFDSITEMPIVERLKKEGIEFKRNDIKELISEFNTIVPQEFTTFTNEGRYYGIFNGFVYIIFKDKDFRNKFARCLNGVFHSEFDIVDGRLSIFSLSCHYAKDTL